MFILLRNNGIVHCSGPSFVLEQRAAQLIGVRLMEDPKKRSKNV